MTLSNNEFINFDLEIDRTEVQTLKFDKEMLESIFGEKDLWPSWVADMDFKSSQTIQNALAQRVEHGIYGYESDSGSLPQAVSAWYGKRHAWLLNPDHIIFSPRTLASIAVLITLFSEKGEGVIVQPPVFYDFKMIINANGRRLVKNPLILEHGNYQMDFEHLESVAADPKNSLLVLCNPHNPIGRVWPRQDLSTLSDICAANNVYIIADEIHGDITYQRNYIPLGSISSKSSQNCATCISPVKSFNLAGVANSMIVIDDEEKRMLCKSWFNRMEINKNNVFTTAAMLSAYTQGEPWLDQVIEYLDGNIDTVRKFLQQRIPSVKLMEPEGTYLIWLDFRDLGLDVKQLGTFLVQQAGIASNPGHWFGREGAGFARINIACPRRIIVEALGKLEKVVGRLADSDLKVEIK